MAIDKEVVAEAYRGMADTIKVGAIADYMPVFTTERMVDGVRYPAPHRWDGVICKDCKKNYGEGHDPDCKVGHREGVGRLY